MNSIKHHTRHPNEHVNFQDTPNEIFPSSSFIPPFSKTKLGQLEKDILLKFLYIETALSPFSVSGFCQSIEYLEQPELLEEITFLEGETKTGRAFAGPRPAARQGWLSVLSLSLSHRATTPPISITAGPRNSVSL